MATNRVDYQDYGRGQHKRQQISFLTDLGIKVENIETIRHVDQLRFNLPLEQFSNLDDPYCHVKESCIYHTQIKEDTVEVVANAVDVCQKQEREMRLVARDPELKELYDQYQMLLQMKYYEDLHKK